MSDSFYKDSDMASGLRDWWTHARKRVLAIADDTTVTVIELETAEILSTHNIDPSRSYWRNTQKDPGRWPGSS